ncbi:MAG: aldo/keto reductase [Thermoanaerobaculaceae bacterium]|jgi:aryl-alcohol dehydrogenase-like predicted oxidoreductase
MEYRTLGSSGPRVSVAGLGCNNFGGRIDLAATKAVVTAALDAGITFFDTARIYGDGRSEQFLGQALGTRRKDVVIATKFGMEREDPESGGSRRYVMRAVETSLKALGTDWIDLYQLHQPDSRTPIEETLDALDTLVEQGKVRYGGCSNFAGWQIADAHWTASHLGLRRFVSAQNQWSLLHRDVETEVVPACVHFGIGILPYFPLASGLLTGKVRRGQKPPGDSRLSAAHFATLLTDSHFDKLDRLETWGRAHGRSLLGIALAWLASQPVVSSVIAGATRSQQVRANVEATTTDLGADEIDEIGELVGR